LWLLTGENICVGHASARLHFDVQCYLLFLVKKNRRTTPKQTPKNNANQKTIAANCILIEIPKPLPSHKEPEQLL
jgi:hypothetical protein